ncbi:hypothetical protein Aperf_G00000018270 [Anoplocephala perfoliata]
MIPRALQGLYFLCEPIADGTFGRLYLAIHVLTRQQVAIKVIDKRKLTGEIYRVRSEIEALKRLSHPNIYSLYHVIETDGTFYLVLEYVPGGELFDYILHNGNLEESHARLLFRQLVSAIRYSHSKGIAHRDLKPENILLKDDHTIRVIDFGLCAKNADGKYLNTFCGSLAYAAPEILQSQEYSGTAADIWSMGVILYAMLMGCLPFDPSKPEKLTRLIVKGTYSIDETLSKSSQDLLARMLCVDPMARIGMKDLCNHPWVIEEGVGPIELFPDPRQRHPQSANLNQDIVREIAMYTRIPQVEMTRMLRKRSYDYLMATYMIMEQILNEEGILLILQRPARREGSQRSRHPAPLSRSNPSVTSGASGDGGGDDERKTDTQEFISVTPNPSAHQRRPRPTVFNPTNTLTKTPAPRRPISTTDTSISPSHHQQGVLNENSMQDIQLMPPPATTKRSIEQNNALAFYNIDLFPTPISGSRPPSEQILARTQVQPEDEALADAALVASGKVMASSADDLLNSMSYDLDGTEYSMSIPTSAKTNLSFNPQEPESSFRLVDMSERSSNTSNTTESGSSVNHNGGGGSANLFRNFILARKTTTSSGGVAFPVGRKLKKIRVGGSGGSGGVLGSGNNNVMLAKPDLAANEILEKISESLTKNSIRFTLKRHGFVCTFANDWGRALLEFSIEVVAVVGKTSLSKRLHLQASKKTSSNASTGSNPPSDVPSLSSDLQRGRSPSLESNGQLGIKVKRLHGDAFTYASICRTVLDQAGVKADIPPSFAAEA